MGKNYLLGIDVGSSSVKAALVEAKTGACIASAFYPKDEECTDLCVWIKRCECYVHQ